MCSDPPAPSLIQRYRTASVRAGYRVNSKQATQFRQWATQRLRDYLVKGYAINDRRLSELGKMVQMIEQSGKSETLQLSEAKGRLSILGHNTISLHYADYFLI